MQAYIRIQGGKVVGRISRDGPVWEVPGEAGWCFGFSKSLGMHGEGMVSAGWERQSLYPVLEGSHR